jgi:hypothetical protein
VPMMFSHPNDPIKWTCRVALNTTGALPYLIKHRLLAIRCIPKASLQIRWVPNLPNTINSDCLSLTLFYSFNCKSLFVPTMCVAICTACHPDCTSTVSFAVPEPATTRGPSSFWVDPPCKWIVKYRAQPLSFRFLSRIPLRSCTGPAALVSFHHEARVLALSSVV